MARRRRILNFTITLMLAPAALYAEPLTLTVNLKGFKSDKGAVEVAVFDQPAAFPVEFRDLKPGTYMNQVEWPYQPSFFVGHPGCGRSGNRPGVLEKRTAATAGCPVRKE